MKDRLVAAWRAWAARVREARRWRNPPGGVGPRVYYGRERVPQRGEVAQGGIVKCQDLADLFPNTPRGPNLLYLVSSALPPGATAMARRARRAGARVVVNQDGVAYSAWYGPGWRRANRRLRAILDAADHVIYQSRFCRDTAALFLGAVAAPGEVLHNPVDTRRFTPADAPPGGPPVLLISGSHNQFYRVDAALQGVAALVPAEPQVRLIIAGHLGWCASAAAAERQLRRRIAELGLPDRVELRGRYSQEEALPLLRSAHILLHLKYNDPCPRLVVEAMACGLPIVYSASGGVPELVGAGAGVGLPVPGGWDRIQVPDPAATAAAVRRIWADYAAYRRAARDRAVAAFDVRPWLERHRELFTMLGTQDTSRPEARG